jgi:voltage-gated potassium channel
MVDELRHDRRANREIVLLTDQMEELTETLLKLHVHFVKGSPINEEALRRCNISEARDAILFARSERDENSDSFNLGVLVALQSLNPQMRVVVECVSPLHKDLMLKAGASTAICVTQLSTQLLVQAQQGVQIQELFTDLASNRTPQQVDAVPFEHGKGTIPFGTLAEQLAKDNTLVIGVRRDGQQHVNPGQAYEVKDGDFLLIISDQRPERIRLSA